MLYLILIIAPSIVGLLLGFGLPKLVQLVLRHNARVRTDENIKKNERRLLCIR